MTLKIKLKPFQDRFLFSKARFPAFVAGWASGKTFMLLLKAWLYCEQYPNQYVWFIRKEFVDLRDSTMRDFQTYFDKEIPSDRNFTFPNGSIISFRHGGEITHNNLKNVNLSAVFIEQAEEFETDEQFQMLRGRIRRKGAPYHQICIAANTNGHNWIWKLWKNNPLSDQYELIEATTYDNADNLPRDFLEDIERMKEEAPNQYRRYVLNSWEESQGDDYLFTWEMLDKSRRLRFPRESHQTIIGVDCALYGEDRTVFTAIRDTSHGRWEQLFVEAYKQKDSRWQFGHYMGLRRRIRADYGVVDADGGYGDGLISSCKEEFVPVIPFHANAKPKKPDFYADARAETYFYLRELIEKQLLKIYDDEELIDELLTIRFKYRKGKKAIVSKEEMRKEGLKSPDKADSLMLAVYGILHPIITRQRMRLYQPIKQTPQNVGFGWR